MRTLMKVLKNLFGNNTKISADNIAVKDSNNKAKTIDACLVSDYGVTENGMWVKFANGLMFTVHQVEQILSRTSAWGNMYETTNMANLGKYPAKFKDTPFVFLTLFGQNAMFEAVNNSTNESAGEVYLIAPTSNASAKYTIQVFSAGKWK